MSALAYRNSCKYATHKNVISSNENNCFPGAANTTVQGDILLNGRTIGPFMYRLSGFVHQDDLFMGALTVLEHITFMVESIKLY